MLGKLRKRWKRNGVIGLLAVVLGAGVLVGVAEHKPGWYRPVVLDPTGLERARADAANTADWISGQIVAGRAFDVVLTDRMINEWLFALLHHRADLAGRLPERVSAPSVAFFGDEIVISCLWDDGRWRAILSLALGVELVENAGSLSVTLRSACIGSLPVPKSWVEQIAILPLMSSTGDLYFNADKGAWMRSEGVELRFDEGSTSKARIVNRFVWPNGERPFRIKGVRMDGGSLHLTIEPIR